ncbi:hypothetical protein GCM10010376_18700 [Streptomyces violaceusniger]
MPPERVAAGTAMVVLPTPGPEQRCQDSDGYPPGGLPRDGRREVAPRAAAGVQGAAGERGGGEGAGGRGRRVQPVRPTAARVRSFTLYVCEPRSSRENAVRPAGSR